MSGPGDGQVPAAFRRVAVPAGADVRVQAKRDAAPPSLAVEDVDGAVLLKLTITPDGMLDIQCDQSRLTEGAQRFLVELRSLLHAHTGSAGAHIRVNTGTAG